MADINVSLELDDSKFTGKLKSAETAAKTFGSVTESSLGGIQGGMNRAASAAEALNSKLEGLSRVLVGVGVLEFGKQLLQSANTIKDLAEGVDITIASMLGLGAAAQQSGSNMQKIANSLFYMQQKANDASEGSLKLRQSFHEVGVSLDDLQKKKPDEIFQMIVVGLTKIEDPGKRAALQVELLGRASKGLGLKEFAEQAAKVGGALGPTADAIKSAADLSESLTLQMTLVGYAFTNLLKPLIDLVAPTGELSDRMDRARVVAGILAVTLVGLAGGAIVSGFKSLVGIIGSVASAMGLSTAATSANVGATALLNAETINFIRVKQVENIARAEALTAAIAEARARVATLATLGSETIATVELAAAKRVLLFATYQQVAASAAAAGSTAALATAMGTTGGAAAVMGAGAATLGARLATIGAIALRFLGWAGLIVAGGMMINDAFKSFTGRTGIDFLIEKYEKLKGILGFASKAPAAAAQADKPAEAAATGGTTGAPKESPELLANQQIVKELQAQAALQKLNFNFANDRVKLAADQLLFSKQDREVNLAGFDASVKFQQEQLRLTQEISKIDAKIAEFKGAGKDVETSGLGLVKSELQKQLANLKDQTKQAEELKRYEVARANAAEMTVFFFDQQRKAKESIKDINLSTAQITMTAEEKSLSMTQQLIDREIELGIQKKKSQLAAGQEVSAQDRAQIVNEVTRAYQGLTEAQLANLAAQEKENLNVFRLKTQVDLLKQIRDIQDQTAKLTMTELQKKEYDIASAARETAAAEIASAEARLKRPLSAQEAAAYYAAAVAGSDKLATANKILYDKSREFGTGWKQAMNDYVDQAGNAANTAKNLFTKATQGMEDAIVNFAKTGKFEWKSFVATMAEELLRSQIKETMASLFTGLKGGAGTTGIGGILGSIGSLFGMGGGTGKTTGDSAANATWVRSADATGAGIASMMGGGGASAGGGLSSIFSGIGSLFGGKKDTSAAAQDDADMGAAMRAMSSANNSGGGGGGGFFSGISDTLSNIGSGISDMFGGFFAGGGTIGAGKFGMVGENGPELIGGPANISPMAGSVTYNINAVDAQSFRQMIAQDPSFLHAVVQQGAKSMPGR